ncbi:hypothetical protein PRZ48_009909 [Zasmidium cellare]|uniref:Nineteen complex-related protein 2-domain-containing protein n=1 Tax=Zasmidium cellare TaxID=395010 RepID=A0ABR0EE30_ZASCE|nr:hypothetical protein PRZ48_009909 [Zasmidium cellare]
MKKSSSLRRVPRKIGQDDDDEEGPQAPSESVIKRPAAKPRKSTSLRQSFGPSAVEDEEDSEAAVITPKKSNVSRIAIQRNASKRSSLLASQIPARNSEDEEDRPSYSAASLQELKDSTPSTPQNADPTSDTAIEHVSSGTQALDISSKFGSSLARYQQSSAIPSATEIAEKKARRARLAKEQQAEEFISLDPDDPDLDDEDDNVMKDENGRLVLKPKDKYGQLESRLVADDEDIMENFDEFTEDGRIALGRKAEAEAARRRKQEMAAQIAEAEGASDAESDDSERERNEAFENAQTKHGTYVQNANSSDPADLRPKTPPIITPLPTLDGAIERLRKQLSEMQSSRMQKLQAMEHLQREKIRLAEEEVRIQRALKETAEKFEELRKEKGIGAESKSDVPAIEAPPELPLNGDGIAAGKEEVDRERDDDEEMEDEEDEEEESGAGFAGLGFGGSRTGLGAGFGLGFKAADDGEGSRS